MEEKQFLEMVGMKLKNLRKSHEGVGNKNNLTQEDLGKILKMSPAHLRGIEKGRGNPTLSTLKRLAEYYEVTVEELLAEPSNSIQKEET